MKKRLNTESIANELRGGSAFFPDYEASDGGTQAKTADVADVQQTTPEAHSLALASPQAAKGRKEIGIVKASSGVTTPEKKAGQSNHDTMVPRHHDTTVSSNHDTMVPVNDDVIFEIVRKAVKQIGKEAATHRFTLEEKNQLTDIEYTYKRRGIKTSENEITRIAINYFIEEYRLNGEQSLLAKILNKLNS